MLKFNQLYMTTVLPYSKSNRTDLLLRHLEDDTKC